MCSLFKKEKEKRPLYAHLDHCCCQLARQARAVCVCRRWIWDCLHLRFSSEPKAEHQIILASDTANYYRTNSGYCLLFFFLFEVILNLAATNKTNPHFSSCDSLLSRWGIFGGLPRFVLPCRQESGGVLAFPPGPPCGFLDPSLRTVALCWQSHCFGSLHGRFVIVLLNLVLCVFVLTKFEPNTFHYQTGNALHVLCATEDGTQTTFLTQLCLSDTRELVEQPPQRIFNTPIKVHNFPLRLDRR